MKTWPKIIAGIAFVVVIAVLLVAFVCPQIAATRYGYLDVNNGRKKLEWASFGRVYQQSVEDTEYSRLLRNLGFDEMPADWKLATQEELGLRRLFCTQFVDYNYGRIEANSKIFALSIGLKKLDTTRERDLAAHFRTLIQKGNVSEVKEYVNLLGQEK